MPVPKSCPQNDVWQQLLTETLAAEEEASLVTHLDHCTRCQHVLESLAGGSDLSGAVARHLSCHEQSDKQQLQPWSIVSSRTACSCRRKLQRSLLVSC
jgi:hypothetical protein